MKNLWLMQIALLIVTFVLGSLAHRYRSHLVDGQFLRDHFHFRQSLQTADSIMHAERLMVFLALGQSNAANYGLGDYKPRNEVYNYYKGKLYKAEEPLLGSDGKGSSVWTRVADIAIDSGLYDRAIIVPCGIGQTSVSCWSEGKCGDKLNGVLDDLVADGINLTHIFWCQGETDNVDNTTTERYESELGKVVNIFRDRGIDAPFFIALTSYFPFNNENPKGISQSIIQAQMGVLDSANNILQGPNVDALNLAYYRYDAVHFSEKGLDALAMKWFQKIKRF
ncbi:sialate O-acetylesterase [Parapedobacter tibetensis]|uniref:sialate O-acetylesterase n=1 Tax=Parapedobacter tibetensis TaxID=2972951 RepID=UPI00214DE501|nr:sialate O-acetylesterase [Parapedobacter tibetensis]